MRRTLSILATAMLAAAPLAVTATAHAAIGDGSVSVWSGGKSVTTSTGKSLKLAIAPDQATSSGTKTSSVDLYLSTGSLGETGRGEQHGWYFPLPSSDITYNSSNGSMTIATGTGDLGPFGSMNLTFTKSSATTSCHSQQTNETGTLAGSLHFDTQTTKWGTVNKNLSFGSASLYAFFNNGGGACGGGGGGEPCRSGLFWNGPQVNTSPYIYLSGHGNSKSGSIAFTRGDVQLASPAGATRFDSQTVSENPPTLNNGVLHIPTGGPISGKATIQNGTRATSSFTCHTAAGAKKTETDVTHYNADWHTPSTDQFTVHFQITPDYQAPLHYSKASYTKSTLS